MQYQDYEYETTSDEAPWTAPATTPAQNYSVQMMPLTPNPLVRPAGTVSAETAALAAMLQSVQQTQAQQIYVLRQLDTRLTRLEDVARYRAPQLQTSSTPSFERATWWAIWGLLMLVLGGALAVVMLLLLLNIQFR